MLFIQLTAVHGSFLPCGLGVSQVQCAGYKYTATCELQTALGGCEMRFDLMWNLYGAMTSQTWNSFMLMKEEDRTALVHIIAKEEHQLQPSRGSSSNAKWSWARARWGRGFAQRPEHDSELYIYLVCLDKCSKKTKSLKSKQNNDPSTTTIVINYLRWAETPQS